MHNIIHNLHNIIFKHIIITQQRNNGSYYVNNIKFLGEFIVSVSSKHFAIDLVMS